MKFHAGDYFSFFDDETYETPAWLISKVIKVDPKRIWFDPVIWSMTSEMQRVAAEGWMHYKSYMAEAARKVDTPQEKRHVIKRILK